MKITLITLGKLKEKYLRDAVEEYAKRLSRYCKLDIIELSPVTLSDNPSQSEIDTALLKEAETIEKRIPDGSVVTALCVEGKSNTSEQLAEFVEKNTNEGKNMCFIIGSSFGLSDTVKQKSNLKLSLSAMTFPHQLFRVMLLEQIYRAFKINEGSTYHK
ncbi:MAG: 23S rRNA (pseudouridine(1915)-N(3))-methyltransferase RlmH [Clostridia bacterium]|nr:23S rRNA (pseudouridine(1915)-N(3))-methyltransferase RlmH [Clostridia bacterium]MBR4116663.1 23S rRNA (pseudouridine(1915)-N(3))-methyltransferase RlmH [Clostridia bacterium]